jgi:hypothetical protein
MGHGIIFTLDDRTVRSVNGDDRAAFVADGLRELLDTGSYPSSGATPAVSGPWQRVGAYHSNRTVAFVCTKSGATPVEDAALISELAEMSAAHSWVGSIWPSDHTAAVNRVRRGGGDVRRMLAGGGTLETAMFGPDRVAGVSRRSVWWLHADALSSAVDVDAFAQLVADAVDDRFFHSAAFGRIANAFNRAGALVGDEPVLLVWSGNRICTPDGLDERERVRLGIDDRDSLTGAVWR